MILLAFVPATGHDFEEVDHVPQNHPVGKTYGLSGNILVAQAIGGF
jgi:hypothetical protein